MRLIPVGPFAMGNCMDPGEGHANEVPVHTVMVSAFYMDKHEVTKEKWDDVSMEGGSGIRPEQVTQRG